MNVYLEVYVGTESVQMSNEESILIAPYWLQLWISHVLNVLTRLPVLLNRYVYTWLTCV